jgi:hypothetical protein
VTELLLHTTKHQIELEGINSPSSAFSHDQDPKRKRRIADQAADNHGKDDYPCAFS